MQNTIQRANILLSQARYTEAIKEIRLGLSSDPTNPFLLAMLAQAQLANRDFAAGLASAEAAIAQDLESPFLFLILGKAQFYNKQTAAAKATLAEGLKLDPAEPDFFYWLGQIDFYNEKWELALDHANQGLALNAEDVPLLNLRAQSLIKLNRQDAARQTTDDALRRSPQNSYAHANKGYSNLHSGDLDAALAQFKEALRLDPVNDFAREGLKEAIKGKNILYRGLQKYFLWMSRMQSQYQWGFIIGIYVVYRLILAGMESYPQLTPLLMPLAVFYVIFAFSTWIAQPISNLALRLHPLGKMALDEDEKTASDLVGLLAVLMFAALAAYFAGLSPDYYTDLFLVIAAVAGVSMIPVSGMFSVPKDTKARRYLTIYSLLLVASGTAYIFLPQYTFLLMIFALGVFVYSFAANYLVRLSMKEF